MLLGLLPEQTRKWVRKEEGQYADLLTFKQEDKLEELSWKEWFSRLPHPQFHILDCVQGCDDPVVLFKEGTSFWILSTEEGIYYKHQLNFSPDLIYDSAPCLSVSESEPWEYFVEQ